MGHSLETIMNALATVQLAITPPAGQNAIQQALDEPPYTLSVFPVAVNTETTTDVKRLRSLGTTENELDHQIEMALAMAPADGQYAIHLRRPWVSVVIDAIRTSASLNSTCDGAFVESVDHRAAHVGGVDYPGLTFRLHVMATT